MEKNTNTNVTTNPNKVGIHAPWVQYVEELKALFEWDQAIDVQYDDNEKEVKLLVKGEDKKMALEKFLPMTVEFGNVVLKITIIPSNEKLSNKELVDMLFNGNQRYAYSIEICPPGTDAPYTYVMFKDHTVHYWGDNLSDPNGMITTLAQDIAREVFKDRPGVFYSTTTDIWDDRGAF